MNKEESQFRKAAEKVEDAEAGQMFGKQCYKINGKAFVSFFEDEMVFKLTGPDHTEALDMKGAKLFDPSGKGRAMKEWVQVPFEHKAKWSNLAINASVYVLSLQKN